MRATPSTSVSSEVNVELGFTQSTRAHTSTGVRNLLLSSIRSDKVINLSTKRIVLSTGEDVNDGLENKGRVTGPGEEVRRVVLARTSNDNTRLVKYNGVITLNISRKCE